VVRSMVVCLTRPAHDVRCCRTNQKLVLVSFILIYKRNAKFEQRRLKGDSALCAAFAVPAVGRQPRHVHAAPRSPTSRARAHGHDTMPPDPNREESRKICYEKLAGSVACVRRRTGSSGHSTMVRGGRARRPKSPVPPSPSPSRAEPIGFPSPRTVHGSSF
jgi:hypothetical protein